MTARVHGTVSLGDLVATVFDQAAFYCDDTEDVSRLASQVVWLMTRTVCGAPSPLPRPGSARIDEQGIL